MVFFPVKPRPYYMVSGRVEIGNARREGTPDERELPSPDQHESAFGEVGVVRVSLKTTSSDLNHVSKKNIIKRREDFKM